MYFIVTKNSEVAFGQTAAGEHYAVNVSVVSERPLKVAGAVAEVFASNNSNNFALLADGTCVREDIRLDTAELVRRIEAGEKVTVGVGCQWLEIIPVANWPVVNHDFVPATTLVETGQKVSYDTDNLAYQQHLIGGTM